MQEQPLALHHSDRLLWQGYKQVICQPASLLLALRLAKAAVVVRPSALFQLRTAASKSTGRSRSRSGEEANEPTRCSRHTEGLLGPPNTFRT